MQYAKAWCLPPTAYRLLVMVAMMVHDRFHLRVLLFSEIFLRQSSPLILVRVPRALGVHGEKRGHLLHLAAPARRTRPIHGKSRLRRHDELLEPVGAQIALVFVDRHTR